VPQAADVLALAERWRRDGRPHDAERLLRELAAAEPACTPALHGLGLLAYQEGRAADAVTWFKQAQRAEPDNAFLLSCLGAALQAAGRLDEAEAYHRRAVERKPGDILTLNNLGILLAAQGRHAEAEGILRRALDADLDDAAARCNLAAALHGQQKLEEAEATCREALRLGPRLAEAHANLGNILGDRGLYAEAESSHRKALEIHPGLFQAWRGLGALLHKRGRDMEATQAFGQLLRLNPQDAEARVRLAESLLTLNRVGEAIALSREAVQARPADADAHNGLGNAWAALGRLAEAGACYGEAARLRPAWSAPVYNRGVALQGQGRNAEARAAFEAALQLNPSDHVAHSTYVGSLLFDPDVDGDRLLSESRRWAERHALPTAAPVPHPNAKDPSRRLRIGYVSPDLRAHAVAFFLAPVLTHHDPESVEIFCYADVAAPDHTTALLRGLASHWRATWGLTDDELESLIRQDGVDVLVDLCGHLAHNRLRVFARKPAPVQVSWLGYPASTGLATIDCRLTDAICDPYGEPTASAEELLRLPGSFCCYGPPLHVPQRTGLPSEKGGGLVFGSLHKLDKLNDQVVDLWSQILLALPESRLLLCRNTLQGATADYWREQFTRRGLPAGRVELRHVAPVGLQHLRVYDEIDVALDAFPWSGHTTACEALWMGAPVVTLRGRLCAGRMVASVLTAVGLTELIAETPEDYLRIALGLAEDAVRRKDLRQTLRLRMLRSPLCDKAGFTRGLEDAYRSLWRTCRQRQDGPRAETEAGSAAS
jgi:protein O-GlcNAc transferase